MDKSKELIETWKQLNITANDLLRKHKSFKQYNNVRLKMDNIERLLYDGYGIDVNSLSK